MTPLFTKLNLKNHRPILVLEAPASFKTELAKLRGVPVVRRASDLPTVSFALIFVRSLAEIAAAAAEVFPKAPGDPVIWFVYPKATSKRYRCEFNRDTGWEAVGRAGFEGVRQVAVDEDWSALRFRRVDYIKTLKPTPSHPGTVESPTRAKASGRRVYLGSENGRELTRRPTK